MTKNFWNNKTVLITGHTGFKGGWLSLMLRAAGAHVVGYALAPHDQEPSFFRSCGLINLIDSEFNDIRDRESLGRCILNAEPDVIFHLAAQPMVRESYRNPIETYETNIMGTVNLFELVKTLKKRVSVVNVTTDKCYANKEWVWPYRESDELGGKDPYSASKACSELVTQSYQFIFSNDDQYNISIGSARAGNIIGGGDWGVDRLVPDLVRSIQSSGTLELRYPNAVRPWQYVLDPLRGYMLLAEQLYCSGDKKVGAWNFGPSQAESVSVSELAERLVAGLGGQLGCNGDANYHEASMLTLDCSKAMKNLNWRSSVSLDLTIERLISWYRAFFQGQNMLDYSINEIADYNSVVSVNEFN